MNNEENVKSRGGKAPRKSFGISLKETEAEMLIGRIRSLGLDTMGDLVQIMVKHPEVLDHFKPYVKEQMKYLEKTPISSETALEKRLRVLKQLDPEKYKKIVGMTEA